jgi:hypothetical protein
VVQTEEEDGQIEFGETNRFFFKPHLYMCGFKLNVTQDKQRNDAHINNINKAIIPSPPTPPL